MHVYVCTYVGIKILLVIIYGTQIFRFKWKNNSILSREREREREYRTLEYGTSGTGALIKNSLQIFASTKLHVRTSGLSWSIVIFSFYILSPSKVWRVPYNCTT